MSQIRLYDLSKLNLYRASEKKMFAENTFKYLCLILKNNQINILKRHLNLDYRKNYISKPRDIINSQRYYNVRKTHKINVRVDMNNKDGLIMH